ncbi:SH3 domain-containing protein [Acuticoccus sp. MNP-M23]|uniref:SH3 domain-containing protein n=1 Tax=Acuticoccus sp. MNP-M23 TaxID=3072793 RepID=UPI0028151323|nr:SH3 domain-containing protein [Acuticoccus sp. MNP-M23]WMS41957.1 SH3 domain-containing protein [Acuticoccus sp. MNP-M23]
MRSIIILLVMLSFPAAAEVLRYDHNGSLMDVETTGNRVVITYARPKRAIAAQGVAPGQILFDGRVTDGYLEGQSRIFSARCGAVDYFVYGDYAPGRAFRLQGPSPRLRLSDCTIANHVFDGPNSDLVFTPIATRPARSGRGCLTGVNTTLNMRVGPSGDYAVISEIPAASCAVDRRTCQNGWCLVAHRDDLGWVARRFLAE